MFLIFRHLETPKTMTSKILIIDNEKESLQSAMSYIIEDETSYVLLCAPNGKEGLDIAVKEMPDIIIISWELPEINSDEAIRQLKKNDITKDIPIMVSTRAAMTNDDLQLIFNSGASDCIHKPFEKVEFICRIASHLKISNYINQIKSHNTKTTNTEIDRLHKEIEEIKTHKENDITFFKLFIETLKSILDSIDTLDEVDEQVKSKIDNIQTHISRSINYCLTHNNSKLHKPDQSFIKRLLSQTSNLTTGELQLGFMLKNKLSTKEIAALSFREQASVKVARSRLRKKLGLKESDNLVSYLEQF